MKRLALIAAAITIAAPALAQTTWTTQPTILGAPQYGFQTRGPNGQVYETQSQILGSPGYGSVTTGPNGYRCTTTPQILGSPQYGSTTTCN